jgi:hypothetical protein
MVAITITATVGHTPKFISDGRPLTPVLSIELNKLFVVFFAPRSDIVLRMEHATNMQVDIEQRP